MPARGALMDVVAEALSAAATSEATFAERTTIRRASVKDIPALASIVNDAVAARSAFDEKPQSEAGIRRWFDEHDGRYVLLVAVDPDGEVIGCASLNRYHPEFDTSSGVADVKCFLGLGVQRRGIGSMLVAELERHARQHDFHKLVARAFPANRGSRKLLRKFGFRVVGVHKRDAVIDGDYVDVMLLEKLLSPGKYRVGVPAKGA